MTGMKSRYFQITSKIEMSLKNLECYMVKVESQIIGIMMNMRTIDTAMRREQDGMMILTGPHTIGTTIQKIGVTITLVLIYFHDITTTLLLMRSHPNSRILSTKASSKSQRQTKRNRKATLISMPGSASIE